jgi:hypothetical protein
MAHPYQSKSRHNARVRHILAAKYGGSMTCTARGGGAGHPARGNNSEADMRGLKHESAEASDTYVEGIRRSKRFPRKTGGKVPKVKINIQGGPHLHMHGPGGMIAPVPRRRLRALCRVLAPQRACRRRAWLRGRCRCATKGAALIRPTARRRACRGLRNIAACGARGKCPTPRISTARLRKP